MAKSLFVDSYVKLAIARKSWQFIIGLEYNYFPTQYSRISFGVIQLLRNETNLIWLH